MTCLVINTIIGSGVFGLPSELTRLVGRASPLAVILGALIMVLIMGSVIEVSSRFQEPGGPYLFARTAFGRFFGIQVGWFWLLAVMGGAAANANLFISYLGSILPVVGRPGMRALALALLIGLPAAANCFGIRKGAHLSNVFTVAKLLPLGFLAVLGMPHMWRDPPAILSAQIATSTESWLSAMLLLLFAYGGYEDTLVPLGEVREPRRTVPFALIMGLMICGLLYAMIQQVAVTTIGTVTTDRPLADTATVIIGSAGGLFVSIAVMISTFGWIAASVLNAPRLSYAFAAHNDAPQSLGRLHEKYRTPAVAILVYALLVWILAVTGTFLWIAMATAGSSAIVYGSICVALIRFRSIRQEAPPVRLPFGRTLASLGIIACLLLLTRLQGREALLMGLASLAAAANWLWASQRKAPSSGHL